jgi:hypothetical protein
MPLTEQRCHNATLDRAMIAEWWRRWLEALVGFATGRANRLVVLDIDVTRSSRRWL